MVEGNGSREVGYFVAGNGLKKGGYLVEDNGLRKEGYLVPDNGLREGVFGAGQWLEKWGYWVEDNGTGYWEPRLRASEAHPQGLSIVRLNCDFSDSGIYMMGNHPNHGIL